VKLDFFKRDRAEQALMIRETAARRGLDPVMVEKDFWVSWTLAVLFAHPEFGSQLVFKGGTSLSKVFGVIRRFSEDIDLSVSPAFVGFEEQYIEQAGSKTKTSKRMKELEDACISRARERFVPELERIASEALGERPGGAAWMEFEVDPTTNSPVIRFHYPSNQPSGFEYLSRSVKMELGSLTDQKPTRRHQVTSWVGEEFPEQLADFHCELVALEVERTFWEKATILHAEYHRDPDKPFRDRLSRHYSDMAALADHEAAARALNDEELRQRVVDWKDRFFAAEWARYDSAKPGTFRLAPPDNRVSDLKADFQAMRPYFMDEPTSFESIIEKLRALEEQINQAS
jgi:hypothetical protein